MFRKAEQEVMNMAYNYNKLKGAIKEYYGTQENFAAHLGISTAALSARLNNKSKFSQDEIVKACELVHINPEDIASYFFTYKVQKN